MPTTRWDGPHVGPQGKTFWQSQTSPSSRKYGDENPNQPAIPGSESPSALAATRTPVPPAPKPQPQAAGAAPSQQAEQAQPADKKAPRKAAALILSKFGDKAHQVMHQIITQLKKEPGPDQERKLRAAAAIWHALEPTEEDHAAVRKEMLGDEQPKQYAAIPKIITDLAGKGEAKGDLFATPKTPAKTAPTAPRPPEEETADALHLKHGDDAWSVATGHRDRGASAIKAREAAGETAHDLGHPQTVRERVVQALKAKGLDNPLQHPDKDAKKLADKTTRAIERAAAKLEKLQGKLAVARRSGNADKASELRDEIATQKSLIKAGANELKKLDKGSLARTHAIVSLSASSDQIAKLKELHEKAAAGDREAKRTLDDVASLSFKHLTAGIPSAKVADEPVLGLYGGSPEGSTLFSVEVHPSEERHVIAAAAQCGKNLGQWAVHVRKDVSGEGEESRPMYEHGDGSYNTPVYRFSTPGVDQKKLDAALKASGLGGATLGKDYVEVYYAKGPWAPPIAEWRRQVGRFNSALERVGAGDGVVEEGTHRLWAYGDAIPYERAQGPVRPEGADVPGVNYRLESLFQGGEVHPEWFMVEGDEARNKKVRDAARGAGWSKDAKTGEWSYEPKSLPEESPDRNPVGVREREAIFDKSKELADAHYRVTTAPHGPKHAKEFDLGETHHDSEGRVGLDEMKRFDRQSYDALGQEVQRFEVYPEGKETNKPGVALRTFKNVLKDNLRFVYDLVTPAIRATSKLWYDGARKITEQWSEKYDHTRPQIAATIAAFSPQKDWYQNVSMAERFFEFWKNKDKLRMTPQMKDRARQLLTGQGFDRNDRPQFAPDALEAISRLERHADAFSDVKDPLERAAFMRIWDECHSEDWNPLGRGYHVLTPDGNRGQQAMSSKNPAVVAWSGLNPIVKAMSIMENGSATNISKQLGGAHKVRNFYNNILLPDNVLGDATIDTHAVAAAFLMPLSGGSPEVMEALQKANGKGFGGIYPVLIDAYRELADELGVLPRELQSITWDAIRGIFTANRKRAVKKGALPDPRELWAQFRKGNMTADEVREKILETFTYNEPSWKTGDSEVDEDAGSVAESEG